MSRVGRGGVWDSEPRNCRSAFRNGLNPDYRYVGTGFRVVISLP
jgi:formylglycine-generating enzyme required for sulfatase activity